MSETNPSSSEQSEDKTVSDTNKDDKTPNDENEEAEVSGVKTPIQRNYLDTQNDSIVSSNITSQGETVEDDQLMVAKLAAMSPEKSEDGESDKFAEQYPEGLSMSEDKNPSQMEAANAEDESGGDDKPERIKGLKFALVYLGLAVTIFLAALDQTIVATTINSIGNEFQAYTQISWVGTAYLLCSAGFGPSWGRLSDIFGRKYTYLVAILLFEVGSAVCGAAPTINVLILGRAIAGLGGGGIVSLTLIIITDIVSIREAGKYSGILGAMFGLSSVVGPLLGGAFTDHLTWRWAFYINLPLGGVAAIIVFLFLNLPHTPGSMLKKLKRVDYVGSITVMLSIILILLGVQWGGSTYPWNSAEVIGFIISGIVMFMVFIFVEGCLAKQPIMPLNLFRNRTIIGCLFAAVLFGGAFFGLIYFTPLFFQIVHGDSATTAGLQILPLILSVVFLAMISGLVVSKTGIYRPFMIVGMIIGTVGCALITTWTPSINDGQKIGYLFLVGFGFGWNLQNIVLVCQNAVDIKEVAVVTATGSFFRTLGGTCVLAIMQSVFNTKLESNLAPFASQIPFSVGALQAEPALISTLPDPLRSELIEAFCNAITTAYYVPLAMAAATTLLLFLMEHRPLRTAVQAPAD